jgi:hypothetical protein
MSLERNRLTRGLLLCGLGPAGFLVVVLFQDVLREGYDGSHRYISELSLGPFGWVQTANFLATGVLVVLFAVGLRRTFVAGRASMAGPILIAVFGVGLIVPGIFQTDAKPGFPPGSTAPTGQAPSLHSSLHDLGSAVGAVALTAAMFLLAARFANQPGWRWYSVASGVAFPVAFVATAVLFAQATASETTATSWHGLANRVAVLIGFGWLSTVAVKLLRTDTVHSAARPRRHSADAA